MTIPQEPLYKLIPLTQGQWAIVDTADYEWLVQWRWFAHWSPSTRSFYAIRHAKSADGKRYDVAMHRQILGLQKGDKRRGDHRDHDTLNNCRKNLRIVSAIQNAQNQRIRSDNKTGFKGVCVYKNRCYRVKILVDGKDEHLGYFPLTPEGLNAAKATYAFAADLHFGDFAFATSAFEESCEASTLKEATRLRLRRPNKTGYPGISVHHGVRYRSKISIDGKDKHLGYFPLTADGLEKARKAYEFAKDIYRGVNRK